VLFATTGAYAVAYGGFVKTMARLIFLTMAGVIDFAHLFLAGTATLNPILPFG